MAASWELQLISAIVRSADAPARLERVQLLGIRYEYFATNEAKMLWSRIIAHFTRPDNYGFVPSEQTLKEVFPSIDLPTALENLDDLASKVKQGYVRRKVDRLIENYRDSVREDLSAESISSMYTELGKLQEETRQNADVNFKEVALNQIMDGLARAKENNGMTGKPWPWTQLNEATGGIHDGDFIMVWALPKSMKCVKSGLVMLPDGSRVDISKLPDSLQVTSLTEKTKKLRWAGARRVESGVKDCLRVTTSSGRVLETSTEHLFRTPEKDRALYTRAHNLSVGSLVAMAACTPEWEGAGGLSTQDAWSLGSVAGSSGRRDVPAQVYTASKAAVQAYLAGLIFSYGTYAVEEGKCVVSFSTSSERLAEGAQHLLLRLGVLSSRRIAARQSGGVVYDVVTEGVRQDGEPGFVWERVTSIEPIGQHMCYDVCITDGTDPNFAINDFIVHNTFFGLVVAAHLFTRGYRVLVYSKEMSWEMLLYRLACIMCRLDYARMKKGDLSSREEEALLTTVERLSKNDFPGELFYTQADRMDGGPGGPADIRRKVDIFKPHFVLLDSSYMLEMPEATGANALDWKNLAAVSRGLKQICKNTKTAMMAIMQENERAAIKYKGTRGTASIAMNTGAPQDCDLGLHLVMNKKKAELSIHYAVAREARANGFTINALACDNFDYCGDHLWNVGDDADDGKKEGKVEPPPQAAQPQSVSIRAAFRARNIPGVTLPTRVMSPPTPDESEIDRDLSGDGEDDITGDIE